MILLYNLCLGAALVLGAPLWLPWVLASRRRRRGFLERCRPLPRLDGDRLWIHAASVGEVEAAAPLIEKLLERHERLLLTATTLSGRERLRRLFPQVPARLAPLDLPGLLHWSLRRVRVRTLVLIETELWPNLICVTSRAGGRVLLVSARISDRSFRRYRLARPLFGRILSCVDRVGARSEEDRARFVALGVPEGRASETGDLKLDRPPPAPPDADLRRALGAGPFLVGGSTHAGEEEALISAWQELRAGPAPALRLILAPRHPERVPQVRASVRRHGVSVGLRSAGAADAAVVVLDTLGELASIYTLADLVFCGGTLASVGGHNMVEPVRAGRVVVHGPHTQNQRHQERLLRPLGVLHRVENARELVSVLRALWEDPARHAPAERARQQLAAHQGAVDRVLTLLREVDDACA